MRYRIVVEYDGSRFSGWQLQSNGASVQGALEAALLRVTRTPTRVHGAGRTDAGVHARGQVAHFDAETRLGPVDLRRALNAELLGAGQSGVAILDLRAARADFHARHDAIGKTYLYRVLNRGVPSPLRAGVTWYVRRHLETDAMCAAAAHLVGHHDFAAFRGAPGGADPHEKTERTLDVLGVRRADDEVLIEASGRSFLRYMVRNLVGTLVEVGQGRSTPEGVRDLLRARDRSRAPATAPPEGLCLLAVRYAREADSDSGRGT